MRAVAIALTLVVFVHAPAAADDIAGSISIHIVDPAKKGVAGVTVTAKIGGTEFTATTGSEQPGDAEVAAAARAGTKALEELNSKFAARAVLAGLPLGIATITFSAAGGKPLTITITKDQPIWKLDAVADTKAKKLIGVPKIAFDEIAFARAQADAAKAEVAKAKAEQDAAKAERERARVDQERARQDKNRAEQDARRARDQAEAERLKRARSEAPSKISVSASWCKCGANKTITVSCKVTSAAEVPVDVSVSAFAETASFGVNSTGRRDLTGLAAGQTYDLEVLTNFNALKDCSGCKANSLKCTLVTVTPK